AELRARLDRELVAGEVTEAEIREGEGLLARVLRALVGQPEDEIGRHARDAGRERAFDRRPRAGGVVQPAEEHELIAPERLRADREPMHPGVDEGAGALGVERRRVALRGDLDVVADVEALAEGPEHARHRARVPEAR